MLDQIHDIHRICRKAVKAGEISDYTLAQFDFQMETRNSKDREDILQSVFDAIN